MEPETVLKEGSPHGNAVAVVEDDGRAIHLYLQFNREVDRRLRSVWVRNRVRAPNSLDVAAMRAGFPPMMPASHCRHPRGEKKLVRELLRLVWLPEGDGVALFEGDRLLSALVSWSGLRGFHGFSCDAVGEGPLAWELTSDNVLHERFAAARQWWNNWETGAFWPRLQDSLLARYESAFGKHTRYFAIDGGGWPPKALVWIPWRDLTLLLTLGVCLRPQPTVEMVREDARDLRCFELGTLVTAASGDEVAKNASKELSSLANYPWEWATWLGHGHTLDCDLLGDGSRPAVVLADSLRWGTRVELPAWEGDLVKLLWVVPITSAQLDSKAASGAEQLLRSLKWP